MSIIKCNICNRFYDDSKYSFCPQCSNSFAFNISTAPEREAKTVAMDFSDISSERNSKTQAYFENVDENDKTIGIFFQEESFNPVTGWLVCIQGTVRGKCYDIHMNRNFLGRDKLMDISIPDDLKIARENHLSITYDNKTNKFYAKNENGSLSIDGKVIDCAVEISEGSILEFGDSKYIFIPYCNKERNWSRNDQQN